MNEALLWIPTIVTAFATSALAIFNYLYIREMKKMREETSKMYLNSLNPIFSLRPGFVLRDEPIKLFLLNSGGVAKNVDIEMFVNSFNINEKKFVASIPSNGEVDLDIDLDKLKKNKELVDVYLYYYTSYDKRMKEKLSLDYESLLLISKQLKYSYSVTEKMLEYIGNGLVELHNDIELGKLKSNNITVYPTEKPKRGNRKR